MPFMQPALRPEGQTQASCLFWEGRNTVYLRELTTSGRYLCVHDSQVKFGVDGLSTRLQILQEAS